MIYSLLIIFIASVIVCALLTRYVRNLALSRGWVDPPDSTRHIHKKPVPRLGGVALFVSVTGIVGAALLVQRGSDSSGLVSAEHTCTILASATLIFLVGLYDDFRGLGPYVKFGAQILASCMLYFGGLGIHQFDLLLRNGNLGNFLGLTLTTVWVLLITNAFNLIDGLDGLAAGAALFSTVVLFVSSLLMGNQFVALPAAGLAGAIVGFLRFNFNPATIFLGDSGSLFIGFVLSALALAGSQKASTMVTVAIPVVCFGLPILDVAMAVMRRYLNGRPLFEGDSEHIHHRLLKRGFRQRDAVLILYGVSAFFGLLSLALLHGGKLTALVLVILGVGVLVGIPQLRYQEFKEIRRVLERTTNQKRIIANDLHVRRATEALQACANPSELWRILADALRPSGFDGFGLKLPSAATLPSPLPPQLRQCPQGELSCFWTTLAPLEANWELKIELVDAGGEKCGHFTVYKHWTGKPLMMDIDLLSDGFQSALAGAVRRMTIERSAKSVEYAQRSMSKRAKAASA